MAKGHPPPITRQQHEAILSGLAAGLSTRELGRKVGVSPQTIVNYRDRPLPPPTTPVVEETLVTSDIKRLLKKHSRFHPGAVAIAPNARGR